MQQVVFYVTADSPVAIVRNSRNERDADPPCFCGGVPLQFELVLFKNRHSGAEPYQLPDDIVSWKWAIDRDFDRSTPVKIEGDNDQISVVQTAAETRVVVPCSQMDSQALADLLGERPYLSGFIAELMGYDVNEKAVFVIQIENIKIRNTISGI